ncbi:MAG: hypothetical protein ACE369_17625 [Roseovarius sp.]
MLITTDPGWEDPQWPGGVVRVVMPRHQATTKEVAEWRKTSTVFEFTRNVGGITVLRDVLNLRDRYKQFEPRRFLFSAERMSRDSLETLAQRALDDPWMIEHQTDPLDGALLRLQLGKNITSNALFIHFFRNLGNTQELDPEQVVDSVRQYLGRPGTEDKAAT